MENKLNKLDNLKLIEGYTDFYIMSTGKIYRRLKDDTLREVNISKSKQGYGIANVGSTKKTKKTIYVQKVVMEYWGTERPSDEYFITHIDGNHLNNDINNLKWEHTSNIRRGKKHIPITAFDTQTGETVQFTSIKGCADAYGIDAPSVRISLDRNKPLVKLPHISFSRTP